MRQHESGGMLTTKDNIYDSSQCFEANRNKESESINLYRLTNTPDSDICHRHYWSARQDHDLSDIAGLCVHHR